MADSEYTLTFDEPPRQLDAGDKASDPCGNCGQRWVLAMDLAMVCDWQPAYAAVAA